DPRLRAEMSAVLNANGAPRSMKRSSFLAGHCNVQTGCRWSRSKEWFHFDQRLVRHLFGQPVAGRQILTRYLCLSFSPYCEHIVFSTDETLRAPKHQNWARDLFVHVRFIVDQVYRGRRPIVLAGSVNGGRITKTSAIFGIGLRLNVFWNS